MRNNAFARCQKLLLVAPAIAALIAFAACRAEDPADDNTANGSPLTRAALLEPGDMYGDWHRGTLREQVNVQEFTAGGIGLGFGPCARRYEPPVPATSSSLVDYEISANGPYLVHAVYEFDGASAEQAMHHFIEALELSGECVSQDANNAVTWSLHTLSMRYEYGDEMVSYTLQSPAGDDVGPLGRMLVIRQENLVSTILLLAPVNDQYVTVFYDLPEAVSAHMQSALLGGEADGNCGGEGCT
jgi:hypothetical protein